jgi:hypothetical protein
VEAQWQAGDRSGEPLPTLSGGSVVAGGGL